MFEMTNTSRIVVFGRWVFLGLEAMRSFDFCDRISFIFIAEAQQSCLGKCGRDEGGACFLIFFVYNQAGALVIVMEAPSFTSLENKEQKAITELQNWLIDGGAKFGSLAVVNFKGYRGVASLRAIQKKERIVFIPKSHLITLEMARESPICRTILDQKMELLSPKHTLLAIFLLQQAIKGQQSQWHRYIDILPKDHSSFPINYTTQQLSELIGSALLLQIHEKVFDLKRDYDRVLSASQQFQMFSFRDFCWARTMVGSRMFGVVVDGVKTNILAPFADMLNHKLPKQTAWNYVQAENGFAIESLTDIPEGAEVFDSYGKKCNSRYLLNYGFVIPDNPQNQICIKATLDGPFRDKKLEMMRKAEGTKILKITRSMTDNNFYEAMGFLRFRAINEFNQLAVLEKISGIKITNDPYIPAKTPPMTMQLQIAVWKSLQQLCQANLREYAVPLAEDERRLKQQQLTENMRNILVVRSGQKKLNQFFANVSREVIGVLEKGYVGAFQEVVANQNRPYSIYLYKILSIMPHERKKEVAHLTILEETNTVHQNEEQEQLQQN